MAVNPNYRSGILYNNSFEEKVEKSNVSKPIDFVQNSEAPKTKELASKEFAHATRATAMAQILVGSDLKPNITQREYVNKLIKQGLIPNKHFFIKNYDYGSGSYIIEVNNDGEKIKEIRFGAEDNEGGVACSFYNPKTQQRYKAIETLNGELHISINDPQTGEPLLDEKYRPDGSLEFCAVYKKCEKLDPSIDYDNDGSYGKINGNYYKISLTYFPSAS